MNYSNLFINSLSISLSILQANKCAHENSPIDCMLLLFYYTCFLFSSLLYFLFFSFILLYLFAFLFFSFLYNFYLNQLLVYIAGTTPFPEKEGGTELRH